MKNKTFLFSLIAISSILNLVLINKTNAIKEPDLPLNVVNKVLYKCYNAGSLEKCNICELCQNGAMCRQIVKENVGERNGLIGHDMFHDRFFQFSQQYIKLTTQSVPNASIELLNKLMSFYEFMCYCVPGYTHGYCQTDINECSTASCSNNSTCIDKVNRYECKCPDGYTGIHCEININECESNPCMHNSKCIDLVDGYYCQCMPGYTGQTCSTEINECESSPCMNNGKCMDLVNKFECNCNGTGFDGHLCEHNIDDCLNVNCKHNSTCEDGINSFKCLCHEGYEGKNCEIDIDECATLPCTAGQGICWQNSDEKSFSRRIQLLTGQTTINNKTQTQSILNNSSSSIDLSFAYKFSYSKAAGYWCECMPGFSGANCEIKINECQSNPCGFNGKCIDLINEYRCVCYSGYTGCNCNENIDECALSSQSTPCASQTKCVDLVPDYRSLLASLFGQQATSLYPTQNQSKLITTTELIDSYILEYNNNNHNGLIHANDEDVFIYLDGYYCDCSDLNENLYRKSGNRDVIYSGQNCTLKLNACETLKHMCKHDSVCQSILSMSSINSTEQDIMCLCRQGFTGKYCEYGTVFRLDGSYAIQYNIPTGYLNEMSKLGAGFKFHFKFEFKLKFFNKYQTYLPLMYLENVDSVNNKSILFMEMVVHREYINIRNPELDLDEKLGFYYLSESNDQNEKTWHSIELFVGYDNTIQIGYSVKKIHLNVNKLFRLSSSDLNPNSFTVGKFYPVYLNDNWSHDKSDLFINSNYLNGACFRDFMLNGEFLFKTIETGQNKIDSGIKFGCGYEANSCSGVRKLEKSILAKKELTSNLCLHNSTCLYKYFDFECVKCELPYYGKRCQFESTKLAFISQNQTSLSKRSTGLEFSLPRLHKSMQRLGNSFKIGFKLHRISNVQSDFVFDEFSFLILKQKPKEINLSKRFPIIYYVLSINSDGYLNIRKFKTKINFDLAEINSYKEIWSLSNEKVNLNQLKNSYAFKLGIKLNEKFIEVHINETNLARFELVNSQKEQDLDQFEIESVNFYNKNKQISYLVYDLSINNLNYVFRNDSKLGGLSMLVMDSNNNYIIEENNKFSLFNNDLALFKYILNDYELINNDLNKMELYCPSNANSNKNNNLPKKQLNESIYSISNVVNLTFTLPVLTEAPIKSNKNCFVSAHFKLKETNRIYTYTSASSSINSVRNKNLDTIKNITCEFQKLTTTTSNQIMYSTCQRYSTIQRELFKLPSNSQNTQLDSFINYYFDFDDRKEVDNGTKLDMDQTENSNQIGYSKQRRYILYRDVEFYSISFDLNLNSALNQFENSNLELKSNLFSLNTFDDLTTNRIFLFGVNFYSKKGSLFEFEIFTSKQSTRSKAINLDKSTTSASSLNVNVTFTFNSIELRLDGKSEYLIRLTDRYFNLFFRSLLKAYGSFQLNITAESSYTNKALLSNELSSIGESIASACLSNFQLVTRKPNYYTNLNGSSAVWYTYESYGLIDQTKSISYYHSKLDDLDFDLACPNANPNDLKTKQRMLGVSKCYLITKIDVQTNKKITDFYDCDCNNETYTSCSYNFWSKEENGNSNRAGSYEEMTKINDDYDLAIRSCANSNEFACFNNGTCVDNLAITGLNQLPYACICPSSYTGTRCEIFDPCLNNPCSPDSTCLPQVINNDQITYECKCNPGFLGRNCTIKFDDTCLASPCLNGATCINVTSFDNPQKLSYECMCPVGYEGKRCENLIDFCGLYEPCHNDALCTNLNGTAPFYKCNCVKGWKGVNCTQDIDECTQMRNKLITPCSGHGQCINTKGSYKCVCNEFRYGSNCEFTHICQSEDYEQRPCKNGAFCLVVGANIWENKYECKCEIGYTGINCAYPTCDSVPCKHQSTCEMLNTTHYECNCNGTGFVGKNCEIRINQTECRLMACSGNQTCDPFKCDCNMINCDDIALKHQYKPKEFMYHLILWPLLAIMISLLIILFSIFVMRVKKSRATRGTYSPSRHELQASRIEFNMDLKRPPEERLI